MGLLSRKDLAPDPHVSILLDEDCRAPFRPGDRISGSITFESPVARQLRQGEAIFFGRAVTHCARIESSASSPFPRWSNFSTNETIHYHDDACLFRFSQVFSQISTIEPRRRYNWSFDFSFGDSASLVGPSPYHSQTSYVYARGPHPLPPTYAHMPSDTHYARIEYCLQAIIQFADQPEPLTVQLPPLQFFPNLATNQSSNLVEYTRPAETFQSSRLLAETKASFRDRISSNNPSVRVIVKASLHSHSVLSGTLPLYVSVEIDEFSTPSISIASIDIRIKSLKLRQVNFWRARKVRGYSACLEYEVGDSKNMTLSAVKDHIVVKPLQKPTGSRKLVLFPATFEARLPDSICPSFHTFNINHNFQLGVTIEVNICGKTLEHKFNLDSLALLPGP